MRDLPEQLGSDVAASELADLRQQVAELREAVRARDDFLAIAAHELRNPMTPIMVVAELALKAARDAGNACPPRVTTLLERMQLLAQDFIGRSTRLLDVSRIEAGNLRLEPSSTDLSALARAVAQKYDVIAAGSRSPVELVIEDGIVGVQDWGIGLSADQQARLFGQFEQVIAQHRDTGFGVGLWLANHLVTAMGDGIAVSSHVGEGSTFTVTLPFTPPEPDRTTHDAV